MSKISGQAKNIIISVILSLVIGLLAGGGGSFLFYKYYPEKDVAVSESVKQSITVEENSAAIEAVEKVSPSVVSIIISKDLSQYRQTRFFQGNESDIQEVGGGSGMIVSADGLILTNRHVVEDSEAEYTVVLDNDQEYKAEIKAVDTFNDIAILKIDAEGLVPVELGDSDAIKMGQGVIAIGNSLSEYKNTVTSGVISGVGRKIMAGTEESSEVLENVIQTDAAINPGNSGGPLVNLAGQVVGINTAIDLEGQLIGFSIPINDAKQVVESVKTTGRIIRPYLGIRYVIINSELASEEKISVDYGALISKGSGENQPAVVADSPADKAGLKENDIILEFGGKKIDEDNSLAYLLQKHNVGDKVELKILSDGKEKIVFMTLEELKD